jgi:hypothetical protein
MIFCGNHDGCPIFMRSWLVTEGVSCQLIVGAALHVAADAAAGAQAPPIMDLPESSEQHPVASEPADHEGTGGRSAGAKRRDPLAPTEPAEKRRRPEPATKNLLRPKMKKVTKW